MDNSITKFLEKLYADVKNADVSEYGLQNDRIDMVNAHLEEVLALTGVIRPAELILNIDAIKSVYECNGFIAGFKYAIATLHNEDYRISMSKKLCAVEGE